MKIFSIPLPILGFQPLILPKGAVILTVQLKGIFPNIYYAAEENKFEDGRTHIIEMYSTGVNIPKFEELKYISSIQNFNATIPVSVHIFERLKTTNYETEKVKQEGGEEAKETQE